MVGVVGNFSIFDLDGLPVRKFEYLAEVLATHRTSIRAGGSPLINALEAEGVGAAIGLGGNLDAAHAYGTLVWLLHFNYYRHHSALLFINTPSPISFSNQNSFQLLSESILFSHLNLTLFLPTP